MGKKKQKKKQKKAEDAAKAAATAPSSLHRVGQALLDQARSPMGRQLIASGLVVAAAALARETSRTGADEAVKTQPEDGLPRDPAPKTPGVSEVTALAGMALSAFDQLLRRKAPDEKA